MSKFEQFVTERRYLKNVSERTVQWYNESLKWLRVEEPTEAELKDFVLRMCEKGLKPSSCNHRIRAVNAYLKWSGSTLKVSRLKESQRILPTFSQADIARFVSWKPKTVCERRLQLLLLLLADTGVRISEVLSVRWSDVDWDSLLLLIRGKGEKERRMPLIKKTTSARFPKHNAFLHPLTHRRQNTISDFYRFFDRVLYHTKSTAKPAFLILPNVNVMNDRPFSQGGVSIPAGNTNDIRNPSPSS